LIESLDESLDRASKFHVGSGDFRLGGGYDTQFGLFGSLGLHTRFNDYLYGFAQGTIGAGPRIERLTGRAMIGLGGNW
jgi:hypothetical protein